MNKQNDKELIVNTYCRDVTKQIHCYRRFIVLLKRGCILPVNIKGTVEKDSKSVEEYRLTDGLI